MVSFGMELRLAAIESLTFAMYGFVCVGSRFSSFLHFPSSLFSFTGSACQRVQLPRQGLCHLRHHWSVVIIHLCMHTCLRVSTPLCIFRRGAVGLHLLWSSVLPEAQAHGHGQGTVPSSQTLLISTHTCFCASRSNRCMHAPRVRVQC